MFSKIANLFRKVTSSFTSKGSAFIRVAEHEAAILEAKGKLIALEAANKATSTALDEIEAGAAKIHSVRDNLQARIAKVQATL